MAKIRFFYNGLKTESSKLEKAWFSYHHGSDNSQDSVVCYKSDYDHFSEVIKKELPVMNKSDYITDYVVKDYIEFTVDSPYWIDALKMAKIDIEKKIVRILRKIEKPKLQYYISEFKRQIEHAKKEIAEIDNLIKKGKPCML